MPPEGLLLDLDGTLYVGDAPLPGAVAAVRALAAASLGLRAERVLMVGADVEADVGGAQAAGLQGALVRTGKHREEVLRQSGVKPDLILDPVAELPAQLRA